MVEKNKNCPLPSILSCESTKENAAKEKLNFCEIFAFYLHLSIYLKL